MQDFLSDLRHGIRRLAKSPGFAATAILALSLGIGANTAIFSLVDRVLIRPLPYADPDRLVTLWEDASHISFPRNGPTVANFVDWQQQNQVFTALAATRDRAGSLTGDGPPEMVLGGAVTINLFDVLGVRPFLGRAFTEEEDRLGQNVIILSYGLWQSRYAGDPGVIGRSILMNDAKTTIIGVMPPGFTLPKRKTQFLSPAQFTPQMLNNRKLHQLNVIARLKPGVTLARAQSDMSTIARASGSAISRYQQAARRGRGTAEGSDRREFRDGLAGVTGGGRMRAADRLRQCRQSVARESRGAATRNGDPDRDGSRRAAA